MQSENVYIGDDKFKKFLEHYDCPTDIDEVKMKKYKAIIQSMTKKERLNPDSIKASNRKRIAAGSATTIQDVNSLIKQFEQTKQMMKGMNNGKLQKLLGRKFNF
jgi:signal recognition particle subunit SRP54